MNTYIRTLSYTLPYSEKAVRGVPAVPSPPPPRSSKSKDPKPTSPTPIYPEDYGYKRSNLGLDQTVVGLSFGWLKGEGAGISFNLD